jgi:hypothetical protein
VSRISKANVLPASRQHLVPMASAVHALRVRPTVALNVAKAVARQQAVAAIAAHLLVVVNQVVVRQWRIVRPIPSVRPNLHRKNVQASFWSTRTRHRASVAVRQPVRASVRASVAASLSNR